LITALKYLPSDVKLHVLGDGFNKKRLVKLVRRLDLGKRVKFYGFRKDRLDLLNKSGILVHPSLSEGIPRALMEAMAMERIVVGTNIPGIIDLIKHKKTGLLVPTKDPEKIAEAVKWVLENKKESYKIAKNGRVLIEKEFCASRIAKKYEKIYNDVTR
jgi:glycosyltransferase involved in cell wall biosynthesis